MPTQNEIDTLAQLYLDARERLYRAITSDTGIGTKTYYNTILKQLESDLKRLGRESATFIDTRIPKEYKRELNSLYAYFTKHNLLMKHPGAFASLHNEAIHTIAREMQYQLEDALITVGRQVTRYTERAYDEALRQAGLRHSGIKAASGGTVQDMRNALLHDLREQGFMTVQYGVGDKARQVPIDVYAGMVARSTTREAGNTARLNQLTANGYDLVRITEHYPTCELCAAIQGRVYSISGDDRRFPPLSRAFGAYNNIHPNCRHVATPWIESLHAPEEVAAAITQSNRPFADNRSVQEIALYNRQQAENRKARETIYQYERYRALLGDDAPKSYMAFARMKRENGWEYQALADQYRLKSLAARGKIQRVLASADTALDTRIPFMDGTRKAFIPFNAEIKDVQIIAAPELSQALRMAVDRAKKYGGNPDKWVKKVGKIESGNYVFDVHWEENIAVGRTDWKIKNYKERRRL